jgi:hypothetical protein
METTGMKDRKFTKRRDCVVQRHLLKFVQQGTCQSGEPPQGAGTSSKPREVESPIETTARPPGLTEQGASTGEPDEEDIMDQELPTVRTKLSGATSRKLKKARARQSGTGSLTRLGHKTSPQPSIGS